MATSPSSLPALYGLFECGLDGYQESIVIDDDTQEDSMKVYSTSLIYELLLLRKPI